MRTAIERIVLACILGGGFAGHAFADAASNSQGGSVAGGSGQQVYAQVCQGCHMAHGQGAMGAGAGFPRLAGNAKLANSGYPVYVVLNGLGGMPWFNGALSDTQIASVVNYVRTSFGNSYADAVTPADVAAQRGPSPQMER